MLLPTALGILTVIAKLLQEQGYTDGDGHFDPTRLRVGVALMLMLAYGASVGGLLTPVGSPPNLIGRDLIEQQTGEAISFAAWMGMAFPMCALMFVALAVVLLLLNKPEIKQLTGVEEYVAARARARWGRSAAPSATRWSRSAITVALWITPGVVAIVAGTDSGAVHRDGRSGSTRGSSPILGASLLFLLPTDWDKREFTMTWSDAARIDWGTIMLFGTGIIFGTLLSETGPGRDHRERRLRQPRLGSAFAITVFAVVLAIVVSETTSNTASAAVVVPIIMPHRGRRRRRPAAPCPGGHVRCVVRLHAAGVDATERHRLRLRRRSDHQDDPVGYQLRRARAPSSSPAAAADDHGRRAVSGASTQRIAVDPR